MSVNTMSIVNFSYFYQLLKYYFQIESLSDSISVQVSGSGLSVLVSFNCALVVMRRLLRCTHAWNFTETFAF